MISGKELNIDWTDKHAVINLAMKMGFGMTVFWNGKNYQITHTERRDRWEREYVVFQS